MPIHASKSLYASKNVALFVFIYILFLFLFIQTLFRQGNFLVRSLKKLERECIKTAVPSMIKWIVTKLKKGYFMIIMDYGGHPSNIVFSSLRTFGSTCFKSIMAFLKCI